MIEEVANACQSVADNHQGDEAQQLRAIENKLAQLLCWPGHSPAPLAALARDMLRGCQDQADRQQRRLSRLKTRLAQSPVLFIEGETATGKSFFSSQLARQSGQAWIASIGPATSDRELVQKWVWKDSENDSGRHMARQQQTLLQWAQTQPRPTDDYLTLVLDEANLAQDGLLDCLTGLWDQPPCVYIDGQPVHVSTKHRVILTGNPLSYAGRHMDSTLLNRLQRLHYPPLSKAFLQDLVVEPGLRKHLALTLQEPELQTAVGHTAGAVLTLWQHYQPLLPEYVFTARDLTDICAWVGWYLQQRPANVAVKPAYLASLVWQACQDVLGLSVPEHHKDAEYALRCWFTGRYPLDESTLTSLKTQALALTLDSFRTMTHSRQPDFDTSSAAVSELADCLAQDLMRCQWAFEHNTRHGGRQATLIEGPTGRGKDATLQHLLTSYKSQVHARSGALPEHHSLNATECSWETLAGRIRAAQVHGQILVVSEMNLIPSAYLEGELNAILAGDAHPGFHLFATINPPDYSGRKRLSPALEGRFRRLPLRDYNAGELQLIARRVLPPGPQGDRCAHQLSQFHCHLRQRLLDAGASLPPTARGLQELARAVAETGAFSGPALETLVDSHYQIYLLATGTCAARLLKEQTPSPALALPAPALRKGTCDRALTQWLNRTVNSLDTPWLVNRGASSAINHLNNTITLGDDLTEHNSRSEALRMLAGIQWTESGLTLDPPESENTLVRAFYRRWQQLWYADRFKRSMTEAEKAFPLEHPLAATLALEANRLYVAELTRRVQTMGDTSPLNRLACWQQLKSIADLPTKHYARPVLPSTPALQSASASVPPSVLQPVSSPASRTAPLPCPETVPNPECDNTEQDVPHVRKTLLERLVFYCDVRNAWKAQDVGNVRNGSAGPIELDTDTQYSENPDESSTLIKRFVFTPEKEDPGIYRLAVYDIAVSAQGRLLQIPMGHGEHGLEVIEPGILPASHGPVSINPAIQRHGVTTLTFSDQPWLHLPSLKPDEKLISLRIEPDSAAAENQSTKGSSIPCSVTRDLYTGLHRVHIPTAHPGESFRVSYLLEMPQSRKDVPTACALSNDTRPDASCSQDMKNTIDQLFAQQTLPPSQRKELENMAATTDPQELVALIAAYCSVFSGNRCMNADENQLLFLLKYRQGSCRHRAPVFVVLCRYFAIPARLVMSKSHAYAEYSLDNGTTWQTKDLGGAPSNSFIEKNSHPPLAFCSSDNRLTSAMKNLAASSQEQKSAIAKALGVSLQQLEDSEKTGTPLPIQGNINHDAIVQKLWNQKTPEAFLAAMGYWQNQKDLCSDTILLSMFARNSGNPIFSETVSFLILSKRYTQACQDALIQFHHRCAGESHLDLHAWSKEIIRIIRVLHNTLADGFATNETVMSFCREALQRNWLVYGHVPGGQAASFLNALKNLSKIPEFRTLVENVFQEWYRSFPGQAYQHRHGCHYVDVTQYVVASHSPALELRLSSTVKCARWTDDPEGSPDVGRLLTGDPAFTRLSHGCAKNRPLVVTGIPDWKIWKERRDELLAFLVDAHPSYRSLITQGNYHLQVVNMMRIDDHYAKVIKYSFMHYLCQLQKNLGVHLVYCWMKENFGHGNIGYENIEYDVESLHGHCSPENVNELANAMHYDDLFYGREIISRVCADKLRKALDVPDAHILMLEELDQIYREFIFNIPKKEFCGKINQLLPPEKLKS
ncbi:MAG: hypothetical protein OXC07_03135 [Kistimonas sp.]|nr:hypothetical protein [Kistimonas sp.]